MPNTPPTTEPHKRTPAPALLIALANIPGLFDVLTIASKIARDAAWELARAPEETIAVPFVDVEGLRDALAGLPEAPDVSAADAIDPDAMLHDPATTWADVDAAIATVTDAAERLWPTPRIVS